MVAIHCVYFHKNYTVWRLPNTFILVTVMKVEIRIQKFADANFFHFRKPHHVIFFQVATVMWLLWSDDSLWRSIGIGDLSKFHLRRDLNPRLPAVAAGCSFTN